MRLLFWDQLIFFQRLIHNGFVIKQMQNLLFGHTLSIVFYHDFHRFFSILTIDCHTTSLRSILACVISQSVNHEQSQCFISLDNSICRFNFQGDAFQSETHIALDHDIKQFLKGETLHLNTKLSLAKLYPLRQHIIIFTNLIGKFTDVCIPL